MTATAGEAAGTRIDEPVLTVRHLVQHFPVRGRGLIRRSAGEIHAVCDVSFDLYRHETLGLVGESGCGKTTTARVLLNLQPATAGEVRFEGTELTQVSRKAMQRLRRELQIVFQDPYASTSAMAFRGATRYGNYFGWSASSPNTATGSRTSSPAGSASASASRVRSRCGRRC